MVNLLQMSEVAPSIEADTRRTMIAPFVVLAARDQLSNYENAARMSPHPCAANEWGVIKSSVYCGL
jgi:hypothetical protein